MSGMAGEVDALAQRVEVDQLGPSDLRVISAAASSGTSPSAASARASAASKSSQRLQLRRVAENPRSASEPNRSLQEAVVDDVRVHGSRRPAQEIAAGLAWPRQIELGQREEQRRDVHGLVQLARPCAQRDRPPGSGISTTSRNSVSSGRRSPIRSTPMARKLWTRLVWLAELGERLGEIGERAPAVAGLLLQLAAHARPRATPRRAPLRRRAAPASPSSGRAGTGGPARPGHPS